MTQATSEQVLSSPPPGTPGDPQLRLVLEHALEILALEKAAHTALIAPLQAQFAAVMKAATVAWVRLFGSIQAPADPVRSAQIVAQVRGELARIQPAIAEQATGYAQRALEQGVRQAGREIGQRLTVRDVGAVLDDGTVKMLGAVDDELRGLLSTAEQSFGRTTLASFDDVTVGLAKANRAATTADRVLTDAINGGVNTGITAAAEHVGAQRLDVAEPDCCLTCAGLAGHLAAPGQPFDPALASTFTAKPRLWPPGPLIDPAWHPHCRCRTTPWLGSAGPAALSLPAALQREARRAVVRGWSLPSESEAERLCGAALLLRRGANLPKSVEQYGRQAVKRGRFPTRQVPVGR